jgi:hypothetical protein
VAAMKKSKFPLGQTLATVGVLRILSAEEIQNALIKHSRGEWGDCDPNHRAKNELALRDHMRLISVYHSTRGERFCVVTDSERLSTTILLQDELLIEST